MRSFHQSELTKLNLRSLVGIALQNWNSEKCWDAIVELHKRGSTDTLAFAQGLTGSRNWRKRALGLHIVSQLFEYRSNTQTIGTRYATAESQAMLMQGLKDVHDEVVCAAISGLGHTPLSEALPRLVERADDANREIRWQVAYALGSYEGDAAINTLLRLARDEWTPVRDWATFGIGSMHDNDTPAIRDLLWQNLNDEDANVRGEALTGLAARKDERLIPVLLKSLNSECRVYELEAAQLLASPVLLETLEALKQSTASDDDIDGYWYGHLTRAIAACQSKPSISGQEK